jgi:hypothetical protein
MEGAVAWWVFHLELMRYIRRFFEILDPSEI